MRSKYVLLAYIFSDLEKLLNTMYVVDIQFTIQHDNANECYISRGWNPELKTSGHRRHENVILLSPCNSQPAMKS